MVIIETVIYCAPVVSMTITNAKLNNVAGIVAGVDTLFIAPTDVSLLDVLVKDIEEFIQ